MDKESDARRQDRDFWEFYSGSEDACYQAKDACQKHNTRFCVSCVYALLPVQQLRNIPNENVSRFIKDSLKWISRHLENIEAKGDYYEVDSYYPGFSEDIMDQKNKFKDLKNSRTNHDKSILQKIYYFRQQLDLSMCKQRLLQHMFDNHPNSWPISIDTSHYQIAPKHNEAALQFQIESHIENQFRQWRSHYKKLKIKEKDRIISDVFRNAHKGFKTMDKNLEDTQHKLDHQKKEYTKEKKNMKEKLNNKEKQNIKITEELEKTRKKLKKYKAEVENIRIESEESKVEVENTRKKLKEYNAEVEKLKVSNLLNIYLSEVSINC